MPVFAVVGEVLGAIGAAAGVTGAGVTAGMSILAGTAIVGGVAGLAEGIVGMTEASSKDGQPAQAAAPSTATAQQTATEAQTAQRRSALAAGGETNVTGGSGIILGSDISSISLVGSS